MAKGNEWKHEYLKDEFVVNAMLSKCTQKKELGDVTTNLKGYAHELHETMTDIVKEETEAIVTLAQGLSDLYEQITSLTDPLLEFHDQIMKLYNMLVSMDKVCKKYLHEAKKLNMEQHFESLRSSINNIGLYVEEVIETQLEESGIDLQLYERAIDEYSINVNHLKESKKNSTDSIIDSSLTQKLKLLTDDKFISGLLVRDVRTVYSCLRAYVSLNQQADAELVYKKSVVEPALAKIFCGKNLDKHDSDLNAVYQEAWQFLNVEMFFLLNIIKTNRDLKGFDFVINTFWSTADRLLRDNLPQITASGNPELFQKRFQDTWTFLTMIKQHLGQKKHNHPSFKEHMKRFNLAVYFEIRHQQICASFERDLVQNSNLKKIQKSNHPQFKLKASVAFWCSINQCFDSRVYLEHLCDHFFRLSMLLQSRYLRYIHDMAKMAIQEVGMEEFLINCLLDINLLKQQLGVRDFKRSVYKIMSVDIYDLLEKAISCNDMVFNNMYNIVVNDIIRMNVEKGKTLLQQVGSIPRLYRRTNKSAPTKPSGYVLDIVTPIINFNSTYVQILEQDIKKITDISINQIGEQYLTMIQDVLHSVCKTEESLRRLKSRNVSAADVAQGVDLTSDEAKIKRQIVLDVTYFLDNLGKLTFDPNNKGLQTLRKESGCSS